MPRTAVDRRPSWCSCVRGCSIRAMGTQRLTRRQVLVGGVVGMAGLMAPRGRARAGLGPAPAAAAGTVKLGGDLGVNRMGVRAIPITRSGFAGEPQDSPQPA